MKTVTEFGDKVSDLLVLKKSGVHGVGLFVRKEIQANVFIHETHLHKSLFKTFDPKVDLVNIKPNCLYNHSKKYENSKVVTEGPIKKLYTIKKLKKGSEIYVDYTKDKELEQPLDSWSL